MNRGTLQAIWIKSVKGGPMDGVPSATLLARKGIMCNADQGGRRQVTIFEQEVWDHLMQQLAFSKPPSARRANLMVSGIQLANSEGSILRIASCRIRILGEARPCRRMDEIVEGLKDAMQKDWFGGAYGEVLGGGVIAVGDPVYWEE